MLEECIVAGESTAVSFIVNAHNITAGVFNRTKNKTNNNIYNNKKMKASSHSGKYSVSTTRKCKSGKCALLIGMAYNMFQ